MYLWSSSNNSITNNNVTDNFYSIFLHTSNYNGLTNNTLTENCWGYELYQSCHNDIYNNYVDSLNRGVNLRTNSNENQVINNNLSYQTCGVVMRENSNENVILNNTMFENSYYGIELSGSHNNHIIDNYISSNRQYGIYIASSLQNTITGNTLLGDSIYIRGFSLDYWNTHDIDTLNTVNGKPVYYWKNITGGVIPPGAGQVILANCDNIVIENQELIDASVGILLGYSSFNNIEYNDISSHKEYSITLYESHWNDFNHNTITSENIGVYLKDSNDNTFHHNNFQNFFRQVNFENSINNHWDDGFGEGNFWSDYKGKDNGSGGRTAGDGVGDTEIPHPFINKGNGYYRLDNYPLMFPIGNYTFLYQGWNLISIPFIQSDTELGTVLSPITDSYDAVQWLNVYDLTDPWKHYHTLKPSHLNDLSIPPSLAEIEQQP
jgi:parallel beta-helix repeat protein